MSSRPLYTTEHFDKKRLQGEQEPIKDDWIAQVYSNPDYQQRQKDGRLSLYGKIEEMNNRYLRIVLLRDERTIKDAYFVDNFHRVPSAGSWSKIAENRMNSTSGRGRRLRSI